MKKILLLLVLLLGFTQASFAADEEPLPTEDQIKTLQAAAQAAAEAYAEKEDIVEKRQESIEDAAKTTDRSSIMQDVNNLDALKDREANGGDVDATEITKLEDSIKGKLTNPSDYPDVVDDYRSAQEDAEAAKIESREANSAYGAAQGEIDRQAAKNAIDALSRDSGSFNTDEFLSVGNEKNLTLDTSDTEDTNLIQRLLSYMITIAGSFGVLMLIVGGFFMVTSEGDDNRLQKGKNIFLYTILGIVTIFVSYIIVQFVISVLFQ